MYKRILFVLCVVGLLAAPVLPQDEEFGCTVEEWKTALTEVGTNIITFADEITTEQEALDTLLAIETAVISGRAFCAGAQYSSETNPTGIIGPINFSGTIYQATLTTDTFGTLESTVIDGDCGLFGTGPDMFMIEMSGGAVTDLWEMGGDCQMLIEVSLTMTGDWSLEIERLK